jgi:hypothetical protein
MMNMDEGMAVTVAPQMPSPQEIAACRWLPEAELAYYSQEFGRTTFKGAVQWFRCQMGSIGRTELELFSGQTIDVPSCFISGSSDWATYRKPGQSRRCGAFARGWIIFTSSMQPATGSSRSSRTASTNCS